VLAYVIERIARSGTSPSTPEMSRALNISETRVKQLVAQLIEKGSLERTPGAVRGLRVPDVAGSRIVLQQVLRHIGWVAAEPMGRLAGPFPDGQLPVLPPFEHLPDLE
jgi:SOS-response transcriptional repressor LexA